MVPSWSCKFWPHCQCKIQGVNLCKRYGAKARIERQRKENKVAGLRPVDPRTISNRGPGHRGRVSYPLLKEFMESDALVSQVDMEGMQQTMISLRATLSYHIRSKDLPVTVFQRDNILHLARVDKEMLEDGTIVDVPNWRDIRDASKGAESGEHAQDEPEPLDMEELNRKYEEERNAITK